MYAILCMKKCRKCRWRREVEEQKKHIMMKQIRNIGVCGCKQVFTKMFYSQLIHIEYVWAWELLSIDVKGQVSLFFSFFFFSSSLGCVCTYLGAYVCSMYLLLSQWPLLFLCSLPLSARFGIAVSRLLVHTTVYGITLGNPMLWAQMQTQNKVA